MKLNIGCGKEVLEGWVNIDKFPMRSEVQKVDVTQFPLPFQDNQFEYIRVRNILEHLPIENQLNVIDELYRITVGGEESGSAYPTAHIGPEE